MSPWRATRTTAAGLCLLAIVAASLLVAGRTSDGSGVPAAGSHPQGHPQAVRPGRPDRAVRVAALGDSVTSGAACGCVAFPALYGRLLSAVLHRPVQVANYGVGGQVSADLVRTLSDPTSRDARSVAGADVVVVTIGANDFADQHGQVTGNACVAECVGEELTALRGQVATVLSRITTLRRNRPTTVLVTGYWNVFEDGEVAGRAFPQAGVDATVRLTTLANNALRSAAASSGATYVDLADAFRHAGGGVTRLLAPDGDHPDAAGHALIARTLLEAGVPHPPPG